MQPANAKTSKAVTAIARVVVWYKASRANFAAHTYANERRPRTDAVQPANASKNCAKSVYNFKKNGTLNVPFPWSVVISRDPSGVDNPGHPFIMTVGCVAGDEESYDVFGELLDDVIEKRHGGYKKVKKTVSCIKIH